MNKFFTKRNFAVIFLVASTLAFAASLWFVMQQQNFFDPQGLDLSGTWQFYNGKQTITEANVRKNWSLSVEVPKPLPPDIYKNLADEFWYKSSFKIPKDLLMTGEKLSISLGSIKGEHEIYWNGKFLASGAKSGLANYRIPENFITNADTTILVRVKKINSMFAGIVQLNGIQIGRSAHLDGQIIDFYFNTGIKPLIPAVLKYVLFFLFLFIYASSPSKKEYLVFALFSFISGTESVFHSKFAPFYEESFFKASLLFLLSVSSMAFIPSLAINFLRKSYRWAFWARIIGMSLVTIFVGAACLMKTQSGSYSLYKVAYQWMPFLTIFPSALYAAYCSYDLGIRKKIMHRSAQVLAFSVLLLFGSFIWSNGASNIFQFKIYYSEFVDISIFCGLTFCLMTDIHFLSLQSERTGQLVPKWFSFLLSTRTENFVFDLPMIVMVVDTAGYTKNLAKMNQFEKSIYHQKIRDALHVVLKDYSGQKISERGDGAIFAWEFSAQEKEAAISNALNAARFLCNCSNSSSKIQLNFRLGLAAGPVRCEWRKGELSFLGDPINAAARLEGIAEPGLALIHDSLETEIEGGLLDEDWISADLKGVIYRAKSLKNAA